MAGQPKRRTGTASLYRVFVSHSTYDKWVARILCEKVEVLGAVAFRDDRDIEGGDAIPDSIRDEIERSDEVLVLLSPQSIQRPWVLVEIGMAIAFRKRIVPLKFHVPAADIPDMIRHARGFDLDALDDYLADLEKRVSSHGR
jgi:hypothetical protein